MVNIFEDNKKLFNFNQTGLQRGEKLIACAINSNVIKALNKAV